MSEERTRARHSVCRAVSRRPPVPNLPTAIGKPHQAVAPTRARGRGATLGSRPHGTLYALYAAAAAAATSSHTLPHPLQLWREVGKGPELGVGPHAFVVDRAPVGAEVRRVQVQDAAAHLVRHLRPPPAAHARAGTRGRQAGRQAGGWQGSLESAPWDCFRTQVRCFMRIRQAARMPVPPFPPFTAMTNTQQSSGQVARALPWWC